MLVPQRSDPRYHRYHQLIRRSVEAFYAPSLGVVAGPIRLVWIALILLLSLLVCVASMPPLMSVIAKWPWPDHTLTWLALDAENAKGWCKSVEIICEVLTVLFIGGAVFATDVSKVIRTKLEASTDVLDRSLREGASRRKRQMMCKAKALIALYTAEPGDAYRRAGLMEKTRITLRLIEFHASCLMRLYTLMRDEYRSTPRTLGLRAVQGFPGGVFGLLAAVMFFAKMMSKVVYAYVAYAAAGLGH